MIKSRFINKYIEKYPDKAFQELYPVKGKDIVAGFIFRTPLMFDLDIKYTSPHKERHYTTNELIQIIKLIWNQIQNSFNLLDDSSDECWITEKVEPYYEEVNSIYNIKKSYHKNIIIS